jgi:hypothetical protein
MGSPDPHQTEFRLSRKQFVALLLVWVGTRKLPITWPVWMIRQIRLAFEEKFSLPCTSSL